ncbi:hypothetical protein NUACC21_38890 [Scytonema sp. NUACC21]
MKRDKTGKFIQSWEKEPKQAVNLSLTKTAWQILKQQACENGISRSELVERYARNLQSDFSFNNLTHEKLDTCYQVEKLQQLVKSIGEVLSAKQSSELSQTNARVNAQIIELQRTIEALQWWQQNFNPAKPAQVTIQSEGKVIHILESITDAFIAYDRSWRYTHVNEAAEGLLRKSKQELIGQCIWDVFPDLCNTNVERMLRKAVDEQTALVFEDYYAPLDIWTEVRAYPSAEGLSLFVRDISESKRLEQFLQQNAQAQTNQRQWLKAVLNLLPVPLVFIEPETGRFTFSNQAANEMAGSKIPEDRPVGTYDVEFYCTNAAGQLIPPDQLPAVRVARGEKIDGAELNWHTPTGVYPLLVHADSLPAMHEQPPTSVMVFQDVTRLKQIEESQRQTEERLQLALLGANAIAWDIDLRTNYVVCSPNALEVWGIQEGTGEDFFAVVHSEDLRSVVAAYERALAGEENYAQEYRVMRQDGTIRWLNSQGRVYKDASGQAVRMVGASIDISERKQTEEALRASAERLSLALEASKMGDWSWDAATDIVKFSPRAAEIFGIPPDSDITWTQIRDLLHQDDRERARVAVEEAICEHSDYDIEYRVLRSDGTERWVAAKGRAHYNVSGDVLGMLGVVQDVTDRKQLEAELRRRERQFKTLAENSPDIISRIDSEFRHLYVSPAIKQVTGIPAEEFVGKTNTDLGMPEESCTLWHEHWRRIFAGGQPEELEFSFQAQDGGTRWYHSRSVPEFASDGKIESILGFCRDVTHYKEVEKRERFLAQASQTFAAASLDLQTVLNDITRLVSEYTGDVCVLSLLSEDKQWLDPASFYHTDPEVREFVSELLTRYPRRADEGIGGRVMQTGEALLMPVTAQDEFGAIIKPEYQLYLERFSVYSTLIVPLKVRGQAIGVLSLTRHHPGEPHNTDDQNLFQDLADRAAMAIANAQLYQQAQLSRPLLPSGS